MPPRPKKIKSNLLAKLKTKQIRQSPPTLQPQQAHSKTASATCQNYSAGDQYSLVEEEERQKVSANLDEMADSSNGKLEGDENVQPGDVGDSKPVVESARDIAVNDGSQPAKETREDDADGSSSSSSSSDEEAESAQVADDSGEVVVEKTEEVAVSVVETVESVSNHVDQGVVVEETEVEEVVEQEKVVASLDENNESSPAITYEVSRQIEEKTLSYVEESNGVSLVETDLVSKEVEESTLPLTKKEDCAPVITDVESKGTEEAEVPCSDEKEAVPAAVADVESKRIEEIKLPVSEEQTGESSGTAYKEEVPAVESADAGQDYGKTEIPESTGNPSIVSAAGHPLQPTSWKSCCGLFEVLRRRSDR